MKREHVPWVLRGYALLVMATWVGLLFVPTYQERAPEDQPSVTDVSPYLKQAADGLARDPAYVDPLLASRAPAGLTSGPLHDALTADDPAVYVAVLMADREDGAGGDEQLLAARLHTALGRDGVYVVIGPDDTCRGMRYEGGRSDSVYCYKGLDVADVDDIRKRANENSAGAAGVYPFIVASGVCILLGWAMRGVVALWRRRVGYLG